uniref:Uncharacterized protein n=1 Tax=Globisporangium ultimum (strain ATCC 200006 / CBS 805.95 / DAOM BR144) TaxID=431595 RepID=K3W9I9_GLOUD
MAQWTAMDANHRVPPPICAAVAIDEGSLLEETEELLAALEPAAFAASPLSQGSTTTYSSRATEDALLSSALSQSALVVAGASTCRVAGLSKKRARTRDRGKDEALELRVLAQELESQLRALHQCRSEAMAQVNKRLIVQMWQRLAERQLRARQCAEAENQKLKELLVQHAQIVAQCSQDVAVVHPGISLQRQDWRSRKIQVDAHDPTLLEVFERLLGRLDVSYAEMDAVFHENGLDQHLTELRSFAQNKTRRLGNDTDYRYIELVELAMIPFDARLVATLFWQVIKAHHSEESIYSYACTDRAADTFGVNHRVRGKSFREDQSLNLKIAMRRYIERDQFVFVWASQSEGESSDLAEMYTIETGWIAISNLKSPDLSGSSAAVLQSCMHIAARSKAEGRQPKNANLLTSLVISAVEEDLARVNQKLESLLLRSEHN